MPLIDINLIDIGSRIREDPGDNFDELVNSIKSFGQLQPIIVRRKDDGCFELIAGERRLRAITLLHGRGDPIGNISSMFHVPTLQIRAEVEGELSDELKLMIEFEENHRRKDFSWEERAKYVRKFHSQFELRAREAGNTWTMEMTAFALKLSTSSISHYLDLQEMMEKHPELAKADTLRGAIKRVKAIKKHDIRLATARASDQQVGMQRASECLTLGDGIEWLKNIPNDSIDLVNLDPPWGDETSYKTKKAAWQEFDDSLEQASIDIPLLLEQTYRVLKQDRFCIFWYRQWAYQEMLNFIRAAGFSLRHSMTPCIWYKPDKISDQMAFPEKQLITSYETFLLIRKGDPVFHEKEIQNVFVEPRVPLSKLIHQTEKPVSLMERLVRLLTIPGEVGIDPTCGSGSFLEAAFKAFRMAKGCELLKINYERTLLRLSEVMK
jgi:ParB-like chromosome segregation protein Spo0J